MKNNFYIIPVLLFVLAGCSKKDSGNMPPGTKPDTSGNNAAGNVCNVKLSDVDTVQLFPADNSWNQDISAAQVDPYSNQIIALLGTSHLKADFGSGLWDGAPIGIPFDVVCGSQPKVKVTFRANAYDGNYGSESDPGPYPIPLNAPIEGNGQGDSHVIVINKDNKILYELYNASLNSGKWQASSGAIFNLRSDALRPAGWTSADAAGLPIFPGLVRYDEILAGVIKHPIRFTLSSGNVAPAYISPARHSVSSSGGQYSLPFGAKIRLKASFNISTYPPHLRVILTAMKKYGLILADIGSNMYISGAPDSRWNNDELQQLGSVTAADFEVVKFH
ncbi:MAG TPA: hypothetical protein VFE53_19440 [Mucilaginibacter sp.]|jgi:hypothetical protein|nr:hypothetical protein [Mucilaginibacter sp.]